MQPTISDLTFSVPPFVDQPFTRAIAKQHGITESKLRSALRHGVIRNVVRGVYVAAHLPDSIEMRCVAARLALGPAAHERVLIGPGAAWILGAWEFDPVAAMTWTADLGGYHVDDLVEVHGIRVTSPVRTAIDIARAKSRADAVACLDALLRDHELSRGDVLARLDGFAGGRLDRVRSCLVLADERSASVAESLIRVAWVDTPLPTPVPALAVHLDGRWIRLGLGLPTQQFAVVISGSLDEPTLAALRDVGWAVVETSATRVRSANPAMLRGMLVGEYHQALLRRVTAEAM